MRFWSRERGVAALCDFVGWISREGSIVGFHKAPPLDGEPLPAREAVRTVRDSGPLMDTVGSRVPCAGLTVSQHFTRYLSQMGALYNRAKWSEESSSWVKCKGRLGPNERPMTCDGILVHPNTRMHAACQ